MLRAELAHWSEFHLNVVSRVGVEVRKVTFERWSNAYFRRTTTSMKLYYSRLTMSIALASSIKKTRAAKRKMTSSR